MASTLEGLSIELVEMIVAHLASDDIKSLRLTARALKEKVSYGRFASFFAHKTVKMTHQALELLVQATRQDHLGCRLQHCTIAGVLSRDPDEEVQEEAETRRNQEYAHLLAQAFGNLRRFSSNDGIASLCLVVTLSDGYTVDPPQSGVDWHLRQVHHWSCVWNTAVSTFKVVMEALETSQLLVHDHLDIFGGTEGCSLDCSAFAAFVQRSNAMTCNFQFLKTLTLSLSAPHKDYLEKRVLVNPHLAARCAHSGVTLQQTLDLLQVMPELESLELHWFDIGAVEPASSRPATNHLNTRPPDLPRLKDCTLRGICTQGDELLQFLRTVRPIALTLIYAHTIEQDTRVYDQLFKYLTAPECPVTQYRLDDLRHQSALLHYENEPGSPKFSYTDQTLGPSTLVRLAGHVKIPISYRFASGRVKGSSARRGWIAEHVTRYGPPRDVHSWLVPDST